MDHTQRVEHIKESIPDSYQVIVTQMQQTVFAMNLAKKKKKIVLSSKDVIAQLQARAPLALGEDGLGRALRGEM